MSAARVAKAFALLVVAAVVVPVLTAGTVLASFLFLPLPASLPEPRQGVNAQVSRVYDINGHEIGQFRQFEITDPVQPEDIPEILKQALVAAEDRRFYEHGGVDIRGTLRAIWTDVREGGAVQGGSTITQQYVKEAFVGSERSLSRKIREAVLASQLDRTMDKDEILFRYLDRIYFGEGAYGIGAAAQTYFRKSNLHELTLSEVATLVGLIPAPSFYEPRGNAEGAENKRQIVLRAMLETGAITQEQYDAALPYRVYYGLPLPEGTPVTNVFPREEQRSRYPYYLDYVRRYLEARLGADALYNRGLQIYTTLDPRIQDAAVQEVAATLDGAPPEVEMALVSIEPGSGWVKAMVGGRDFYAPGGQVNLALGGSTGKQPGSTFKPFVLATALSQGVSPTKTYSGRNRICVTKDYCPQNFGGASYGSLSLRQATAKSVNSVYVQLIRDVGVESTMELARTLGLGTYKYKPEVHGYSIALGAGETTPIDMASAYGVWAARGMRAEPTPIRRVLDSEGNTVEDNTKPKSRRVLDESVADTMNDVLQGALLPGGTAAGRGIGRPAAGKTGTTNDNTNAWFVGYTPQLSTSVWIGRRDDQRPMGAVKGVRAVTGGTWPARTWQAFMKRALDGAPVAEFNEPAPITRVADDARREARKGFDVGERRRPAPADDGGDLAEEPPPPTVEPPTTTTTTTTTTIVGFG